MIQHIAPPNLPTVLPQDPPTPVGANAAPPNPCADSDEGLTFGRFNNVAIAYGVRLGKKRYDLAVVTDRGCDRLRTYAIDPHHPHGPLIDLTSASAPRVYAFRYIQPSPLQLGEVAAGLQGNPLDEQDTAYGIGLWQHDGQLFAFVSQRNRSLVLQVRFFLDHKGRVSYHPLRALVFDPNFTLEDGDRAFDWTPCRENANEDPQSEGIVIDPERKLLYVAFETIGVYRLRLDRWLPPIVRVGRESLFEPVKSFGRPYWAIPDEDEFACEYAPEGDPDAGTIVAPGSDAFAGERIEVDVEGLAIYPTGERSGYVVVSSQGDNTFHLYDRRSRNGYIGAFAIIGTGDSDGVEVTGTPLGQKYPRGLLVVQNGEAEDPPDTGDINGFEYDGSTQFRFVSWRDVEAALGLR